MNGIVSPDAHPTFSISNIRRLWYGENFDGRSLFYTELKKIKEFKNLIKKLDKNKIFDENITKLNNPNDIFCVTSDTSMVNNIDTTNKCESDIEEEEMKCFVTHEQLKTHFNESVITIPCDLDFENLNKIGAIVKKINSNYISNIKFNFELHKNKNITKDFDTFSLICRTKYTDIKNKAVLITRITTVNAFSEYYDKNVEDDILLAQRYMVVADLDKCLIAYTNGSKDLCIGIVMKENDYEIKILDRMRRVTNHIRSLTYDDFVKIYESNTGSKIDRTSTN